MSQLKQILNELYEVSNQVSILIENNEWNILSDILSMIKVFGEKINSNGIRTNEDIIRLSEIKSQNPALFANIVYDNLQLLISEYEVLSTVENKKSLVYPFNFNSYQMALLKDEDGKSYFINEMEENLADLINQLPEETEAIILIGYGSGGFYSKLSTMYHTLVVDPFVLLTDVESEGVLTSPQSLDKQELQKRLQRFIGLKTEVIAHPLYKHSQDFIEQLKSVRNFLQEVQIDLNTRMKYTEKWYKEIFRNAFFLNEHTDRLVNIDELKDYYQGKKALMIAGGPSLEEAIPYLKAFQESYYIIAIGQTAKVLLNHQIRPDYVISIDVSDENAHFFKDIKLDMPLVYSLQVNHKIPQGTEGPLIPYADMPLAHDLLPYSNSMFTPYPTVALAAVSFAYHLGFEEIGLVGQDLALREGVYYSASVKEASSNDGMFHKKVYEIPLNNGNRGETTPILFNFLSGYKILFDRLPGLASRLVNYAEKGAVIEGVPYKPLDTMQDEKGTKLKLKFESNDVMFNVPVMQVQRDLVGHMDRFERLSKKLGRSVKQRAVNIDEFEALLREWDSMLDLPAFRTHIMPLQFVNLLIIQNKIKLHNQYRKSSSMRIQILHFMKETIDSLIKQLSNIHELKIEV